MPRGRKDKEVKADRARRGRVVERLLKEAAPAKDVTLCPVCDGRGKPGGCNLCGVVE